MLIFIANLNEGLTVWGWWIFGGRNCSVDLVAACLTCCEFLIAVFRPGLPSMANGNRNN